MLPYSLLTNTKILIYKLLCNSCLCLCSGVLYISVYNPFAFGVAIREVVINKFLSLWKQNIKNSLVNGFISSHYLYKKKIFVKYFLVFPELKSLFRCLLVSW